MILYDSGREQLKTERDEGEGRRGKAQSAKTERGTAPLSSLLSSRRKRLHRHYGVRVQSSKKGEYMIRSDIRSDIRYE